MNLEVEFRRLLQAHRGQLLDADDDVAFVHGRHEGLAHQGVDTHRERQHDASHDEDQRLPAQGKVQDRRIQPQCLARQPGIVVLHLLEQEGRQHGNDGQRQDERTGEREHDRHRHGHEELAFQTLQRHQGKEHDGDDQNAGSHGGSHLAHRPEHHVLAR